MNHPTREEWMSYLYDEFPNPGQAALQAHLESCPTCRANVAGWQSAMTSLESWTLPKKSARFRHLQPALKWGIAALFALGMGYGFARFSVPAANVETLRAGLENSIRTSLEKEIQARLHQQLRGEIKAQWADAQSQLIDRMDTLAAKTLTASFEQTQGLFSTYDDALAKLDNRLTQQSTAQAALRKDTERMAVLTEYGFRRNEQQWVQLANDNEPPNRLSGRSRNQDDP